MQYTTKDIQKMWQKAPRSVSQNFISWFQLLQNRDPLIKEAFFLGIEMNFLTEKVWAGCKCRTTMRASAFERSSIREAFDILFCGHTTHRIFFRSTRSYGASTWLLVRNPYKNYKTRRIDADFYSFWKVKNSNLDFMCF